MIATRFAVARLPAVTVELSGGWWLVRVGGAAGVGGRLVTNPKPLGTPFPSTCFAGQDDAVQAAQGEADKIGAKPVDPQKLFARPDRNRGAVIPGAAK